MKTNELTGTTLDYWVAKCEGEDYATLDFYAPSQLWDQGGPIIEREGMHIDCLRMADHYRPAIWEAWPYKTGTKDIQQGPTPLIAAMRCYVASKFGDEVTE